MYSQNQKITGYHGTYPEYLESIQKNNFEESKDHEMWIGDGVYFFVEGIGAAPAVEYSKQFAIDACYDNDLKKHTRDKICVLEAVIKINNDKYLDLTLTEGYQLFNSFRKRTISLIEQTGKKPISGDYKDSDVFKIMREELGIEFVKSNVYIRFAVQRSGRFASRIPNVTIFVVNKPTKNIQKPTIKVVYQGEII